MLGQALFAHKSVPNISGPNFVLTVVIRLVTRDYTMNTTAGHTVTIRMLLWEADVHEKNGKGQEAAKIRGWVADLLSEQSKVVRSVWRRLGKPRRATLDAIV